MTLQQVKEQVAYDSDYTDWNALVNEMAGDIEVMEFYLDIIARQYAQYVAMSTLKDVGIEVATMYKEAGFTNTGIKANKLILETPIQQP